MRYLEVSVHQPPDRRNPMHQFVVDDDRYDGTMLLHRRRHGDDEHAMLFHVAGPPDPYERVLAQRHSVREFELSPCRDGTSYLYVRAALTDRDRPLADAFARPGLIVVTPVEYRTDGSVRVTAVGPAATVQAAVEAVPETTDVDVRRVGDYSAGLVDSRLDLTRRQFEAVATAVDCGYYAAPREATLEAVADRLDCSTGTAGELLRRAERTVMSNLVDGGPRYSRS
jgi:predicted DNA binding protein